MIMSIYPIDIEESRAAGSCLCSVEA
jgi:hypothetical protein